MRINLIALSVAALVATSPANATTYDITNTLNYSANNFGSSGFHSQSCGMACGNYIARPSSVMAGGTWDSVSGAISFTMGIIGGGTVSAMGNLSTATSTRSNSVLNYEALWGTINFTFAGVSGIADGIQSFLFRDIWHNPEANGVDYASHISIWGDNNNYPYCRNTTCIGGDFRLAITESPAPVPIPATFGLLLLGLGGLFGSRKLAKKST